MWRLMVNHWLGNRDDHSVGRNTLSKSLPQGSHPLAGEQWAPLIAAAGLRSKHKGQSSARAPIFSSTNLHRSEQYTPLKWVTWVICFIERRGKKILLWFSLRGEERVDYPPSLLKKIAKQKHLLSPCYETTHPAPAQVFCNLQPSCCARSLCMHGSPGSPPSSSHLRAVEPQVHRPRRLNQSTNRGG